MIFDSAYLNPDSYSSQLGVKPARPQMARFIENIHIRKALLKNLDNHSNVDLHDSTKVATIEADHANWPIVKLHDGKSFRARLLVGADGFNSPVKSYSQITSTGKDYNAQCVVGTLELEKTNDNFSVWQRFLANGPLGFLPLSDQHGSLAWSVQPNVAVGMKALNSQTLASLINASFRLPHESVSSILSRVASHSPSSPIDSNEIQSEIDRLSSPDLMNPSNQPKVEEVPPKVLRTRLETVASFPLRLFHANQYVGKADGSLLGSAESSPHPTRTALVGDAAHVLHPMTGQGLNLGIGDAKELAQTVSRALENGQDIGGLTALTPFARSRYLANQLIMTAVDQLYTIYSTEIPPLVWARSVGTKTLNQSPMLKAIMMTQAGGNLKKSSHTTVGALLGNVADAYQGLNKGRASVKGVDT